ncbi:MAG: methyltransferase domain-containing protein [Deltaproteobacteria bacterium]|nr:methyltransferase domain-containing protein [Deltaproteobacteria bacterium]
MTSPWLVEIVDRTLGPLNLILRRRSSWEALEYRLKEISKELLDLRSSRSSATHSAEMRELWNQLSTQSEFGFISHLEPGAQWDLEEFNIVGSRFVERMIERFKDYGDRPTGQSSICEIGCGVGRFLKPLARHFRHVIGVDVSIQMIAAAQRYCSGLGNISLYLNDGMALGGSESDSVDYCVSAGVFQHITDFRIIAGYIIEALRILRPSGIFLFQFEGNRTEAVGDGQQGAKITAAALDQALSEIPYEICEVSQDSGDPIRNVVVVLRKPHSQARQLEHKRSFQNFRMTDRPWLTGVYNGIETRTQMHVRLLGPKAPCTFYDL